MIRITKQIDEETVSSLENLAKKMVALQLYKNPSFIATDVQGKLQEWKEQTPSPLFLISQNVGTLISPAFGLEEGLEGVFYTSPLQQTKEEVNFAITLTKATSQETNSDLTISITSPLSKNKAFSYTPLKSGATGDIFYLARYLYNKRNIYENIYRLLLKNKKQLEASLGESFTEDLTALFSVTNKAEPLEKYSIPKGGEVTRIAPYEKISYCYASRQACTKLGRSIIPLFSNGHLWRNLQVDLYSAPENKMLFDIDLELPEISTNPFSSNGVAGLDYFPYLEVLDAQIDAWLNNLKQMTAFGYELLAKIKAKLLLENL